MGWGGEGRGGEGRGGEARGGEGEGRGGEGRGGEGRGGEGRRGEGRGKKSGKLGTKIKKKNYSRKLRAEALSSPLASKFVPTVPMAQCTAFLNWLSIMLESKTYTFTASYQLYSDI